MKALVGKVLRKRRERGFTLLEALLAAAVLGVTGYVLAVAFNNGQTALLNWESSSEIRQFQHWALSQIDVASMDLEALEEGEDVLRSPEGFRFEWVGRAYPTEVLDVFMVEIEGSVSGGARVYEPFLERRLVNNGQLYESDRVRELLVEEKEQFFEALQKARDLR